jgi:hypothetical protein
MGACVAWGRWTPQNVSMSLLRNVLITAVAVSASGCSLPSESNDVAPADDSRISIRAGVEGLGVELNGTVVYIATDDSLIVRAYVLGAPELYDAPVLTTDDTTLVTMRADGSAAIRKLAPSFSFRAVARARSTRTRPQVLADSGKLVVACHADAHAGINITIRDSITGIAPSGTGSMRLFATNGSAVDSLRLPALLANWSTAWEIPGTWTVTIDADRYHRWQQGGIVVTKGLCHVLPVAVTARLQRE